MAAGRRATIFGDGIGGASTAVSLMNFGWRVDFAAPSQRSQRAIVLGGACLYLLERMWGGDWLAGLPHHRLARRGIVWSDGDGQWVEESAIVVDAARLAASMAQRAAERGARRTRTADAGAWTIVATREASPDALAGGCRIAVAAPVATTGQFDPEAMLIEATRRGWLALVPTGARSAELFAFTVERPTQQGWLERFARETRAIGRSVAAVVGPARTSEAAPRFRWPPHRDSGLFVGDAAIALDPMGGEGVAAALRTAHLAAALSEACAQGVSRDEILQFYSMRLARVMATHLKGLIQLYQGSPFAPAWSDEIAAMRAMADTIDGRTSGLRAPAFVITERGAVRRNGFVPGERGATETLSGAGRQVSGQRHVQ